MGVIEWVWPMEGQGLGWSQRPDRRPHSAPKPELLPYRESGGVFSAARTSLIKILKKVITANALKISLHLKKHITETCCEFFSFQNTSAFLMETLSVGPDMSICRLEYIFVLRIASQQKCIWRSESIG